MEEDRYKNKYRTSSFRKPNWDYGSHGLYFVTICTHERIHYFGEINETCTETQGIVSLRETPIAEIARQNWLSIPQYHPYIELDEFVLMPNHLHGIVFINRPDKVNWEINKFGSQSQNLASIIRGYKSSVKKYATMNSIDFKWQSKYHDRVIRDEKEYQNITYYIAENPTRWKSDPDNILFSP
ncbi:transposase [Mucilaginibacter jinjuensis]|uniref:Transposase n=1 Tax=Mucilaginibacter jinjuensis TaxID=1176721 RepID=A0ABY7T8E8_9SPHI|nr:transposase [Mucilaginibacter jinjuensis]WCT12750.1 transposase [Mucilaginibacter jinjuensis]